MLFPPRLHASRVELAVRPLRHQVRRHGSSRPPTIAAELPESRHERPSVRRGLGAARSAPRAQAVSAACVLVGGGVRRCNADARTRQPAVAPPANVRRFEWRPISSERAHSQGSQNRASIQRLRQGVLGSARRRPRRTRSPERTDGLIPCRRRAELRVLRVRQRRPRISCGPQRTANTWSRSCAAPPFRAPLPLHHAAPSRRDRALAARGEGPHAADGQARPQRCR